MNEQQILAFLAVASTKSFTAASQQLYLTQPTVTYQIKMLEKELGILLFSRDTGIALTQAGQTFLPAARQLHKDFLLARERVQALRPKQIIALPSGMVLGHEEATNRAFALIDMRLGLNLDYEPIAISLESSLRDLAKGRIALVIAAESSADLLQDGEKIHRAFLFESEEYVLLSEDHQLAAKAELTPEDIAGETLLISNEDTCYLPSALRRLEALGHTVKIQRYGSYRMLMPFVARKSGVSLNSFVFDTPQHIVFRPLRFPTKERIALFAGEAIDDKLLHEIAAIVIHELSASWHVGRTK